MSFLSQVSKDDLTAGDIIFPKNEVIQFACLSAREDQNNHHIYIDCKILSGKETGKNYTVKIFVTENEISRKHIADFVYNSGFWTAEELSAANKDLKLSRLVGTTFQGRASEARQGKQGGTFQSINSLRCLTAAPAQNLPLANGGTNPTAIQQSHAEYVPDNNLAF